MYLHDYGERAESVCRWPVFAPDALVYGVELEVEPRSGNRQGEILEVLGDSERDFFCKTDGSLESGVEIVTVPMTLTQHLAFDWPRRLRPLRTIAMAGARTRRCGMHVHVNRGALSPLTLAKLLLCVNDPEMRDLVVLIAQRDPGRWAQLIQKKWADGLAQSNGAGGRYQSINLTRHTAEFRIFRGSLRGDRVLKNLESVEAFILWCRETSAGRIASPHGFVKFVLGARQWPHLAAFFNETGASDTWGGA